MQGLPLQVIQKCQKTKQSFKKKWNVFHLQGGMK